MLLLLFVGTWPRVFSWSVWWPWGQGRAGTSPSFALWVVTGCCWRPLGTEWWKMSFSWPCSAVVLQCSYTLKTVLLISLGRLPHQPDEYCHHVVVEWFPLSPVWMEFVKYPSCGEKQVIPVLENASGQKNRLIRIRWGMTHGISAFHLTNSLARFSHTYYMFSKSRHLSLTRNSLLRASCGPATWAGLLTTVTKEPQHIILAFKSPRIQQNNTSVVF